MKGILYSKRLHPLVAPRISPFCYRDRRGSVLPAIFNNLIITP